MPLLLTGFKGYTKYAFQWDQPYSLSYLMATATTNYSSELGV